MAGLLDGVAGVGGGGGLLISRGDGCIRRSLRFFITAKGRSVA